jgi:hypothetical protein
LPHAQPEDLLERGNSLKVMSVDEHSTPRIVESERNQVPGQTVAKPLLLCPMLIGTSVEVVGKGRTPAVYGLRRSADWFRNAYPPTIKKMSLT